MSITKSYSLIVSTHSHPKVAAGDEEQARQAFNVSTHSHPKVAAANLEYLKQMIIVSTHSHPKVAAAVIVVKV